jgi:hypothetical protein
MITECYFKGRSNLGSWLYEVSQIEVDESNETRCIVPFAVTIIHCARQDLTTGCISIISPNAIYCTDITKKCFTISFPKDNRTLKSENNELKNKNLTSEVCPNSPQKSLY